MVTPIVYDKAGNRGVRIQLAAVQILRDGERLDGDGGARALEMLGVDVAAGAPDLSFDPDDLGGFPPAPAPAPAPAGYTSLDDI